MQTRRDALIALSRCLGAGFLAFATGLAPLPVAAGPLEDAKAKGFIGERPDGYVGLVRGNAPLSVRKLADQINKQRWAQYAGIAKRTGADARQVGVLAGRKLIANARRGTYVMDGRGSWKRK